MDTVTIHTAKTTLSQLLARVEAGEEIILARGARPIAKLVPYERPVPKRRFGAFKAIVSVGPEFFAPLPAEELEVWEAGYQPLRLLLDTHALLWWLSGDDALSATAKTAIGDEANAIFVSAASAWEIATKHRLGKLPGADPIVLGLDEVLADQGFIGLPITLRHGQAAGALPGPHRDPFDRMLMAHAMLEDLVIVSNEQPFDAFGVRRMW